VFDKLQTDYQRFLEIERLLLDPEVTADAARVTALAKERGTLAKIAIPYGRYLELSRQITEAEQLCASETDSEMRSYAEAELDDLRARHQREGENLRDMLYDSKAGTNHAAMIVEIRAGTGGDEAALFARDLFEMYRRFAEQMSWKFETLDLEPTELAGFREVSFSVAGQGAFRHLQFESGCHRVQRVPQTEAQGRIHTSTATVAVLPEPEEVDIVIRTEDLLIDVMRSGGPGGQHQNKTESGVRYTHLPTGVAAESRSERSQHKNDNNALAQLKAKLIRLEEEKREAEFAKKYDEKGEVSFGNQIRSYVLQPYQIVKDLRTDFESGNPRAILDGNIDGFIEAYLRMKLAKGGADLGKK
jgi:peptide chain release factor 1